MRIDHILALVPFVGVFLVYAFIWRKAIPALTVVGYAMAMTLYMMWNSWEWFAFPIVAIIGLFSLYQFIKFAIEGELV